jgi:pyridoxine kinase
MRRILVISSHVAFGSVGLAATIAALQRARIEVASVPTIVLSNHPGHARFAGKVLEPEVLEDITAALDANGWLQSFDAVFSGYLPSARHVEWVARLVVRMRSLNPASLYVCDPILGDDPKGLYVDVAAAQSIRDLLVPCADVLTPNRFELSWLARCEVHSEIEAITAGRTLNRPIVVATSIPSGAAEVANVLVTEESVAIAKVERMDNTPHGTGDLFAGLLTAQLVAGRPAAVALDTAVNGVRHALQFSRGRDRLLLEMLDWERIFAGA